MGPGVNKKGGSAEKYFGDAVYLFIQALDVAHHFAEGNADNLVGVQRSHVAPLLRLHHLVAFNAEARGEHAVERGGRAAALHVAELGDARLYPGAAFDLVREDSADATEAVMTVDLLARLAVQEILFRVRVGVFGDDDYGEGAALVATVL